MPHYRMTIKLEDKNVQEFIIDDTRIQIDFVYLDYRRRVREKNGTDRVIYFDLVMLADESLKHLEDREEVYNEKNNFGLAEINFPGKLSHQRLNEPKMTPGEKAKYNRSLKPPTKTYPG